MPSARFDSFSPFSTLHPLSSSTASDRDHGITLGLKARGGMIAIIDYGMGNLRSVYNAFQSLGREATIASKPQQLRDARGIVLPGVGAFGDGMHNLREWGFVEELDAQVLRGGKPFLGLCLGLQLLATTGFEHGKTRD